MEFRVDVVKSPQEFAEHVRATTYDSVLSDHSLGHWAGVEALRLSRVSGHDIPFILVTGALDGEGAIGVASKTTWRTMS